LRSKQEEWEREKRKGEEETQSQKMVLGLKVAGKELKSRLNPFKKKKKKKNFNCVLWP
jgi:hypothetical protein